MQNEYQQRHAEKIRELNGFGDKKLNQLASAYVNGATQEERSKAYNSLQRHYPGLDGEEQNLSPQAVMMIETFKSSIGDDDDTFGPDDL